MSRKEKKSFSEKKKDLSKKLNKIWIYSTCVMLALFIFAGIYTGVKSTVNNQKEIIRQSLMEYNKTAFGYNPDEKPYQSAFVKCGYRYTVEFADIIQALQNYSSEVIVYPYYDMVYLKIKDYTLDIAEVDNLCTNEAIAGWCIENKDCTYYGSPRLNTTPANDCQLLEFTSNSIDDCCSILLNVISYENDYLVRDSNYGTFFVSGALNSHLAPNIDNIDSTNMYLIIASIMDCGSINFNALDFVESYYVIRDANFV